MRWKGGGSTPIDLVWPTINNTWDSWGVSHFIRFSTKYFDRKVLHETCLCRTGLKNFDTRSKSRTCYRSHWNAVNIHRRPYFYGLHCGRIQKLGLWLWPRDKGEVATMEKSGWTSSEKSTNESHDKCEIHADYIFLCQRDTNLWSWELQWMTSTTK